MYITDVVLHVDETLDAQGRHALEDEMRGIDGVISPGFSPRTPHLMIVTYNPDRIPTGMLLQEVQRRGYHAQHCGG